MRLCKEYAIAVTEKSIAAFHSVPICRKHALPPGKCAYQHQQTGLRQMKVGQQGGHHSKVKHRGNEDICLSGVSPQGCGSSTLRRGLEGTHHRCAYCDNAASLAASTIHGVG